MKRTKGHPDDLEIMRRLASVEQYLERLKADFESSGFRPNDIVRDGIARGFEEVEVAVESAAAGEFAESGKASTIAWLHAYFARSIFDAEVAEHYLGENDFLELSVKVDDWRTFVDTELASLEEEIVGLRKEIKSRAGGS